MHCGFINHTKHLDCEQGQKNRGVSTGLVDEEVRRVLGGTLVPDGRPQDTASDLIETVLIQCARSRVHG